MHRKIRIFAEESALIKLNSNNEFRQNKTLKFILKNLSEIILIMEEEVLQSQWNDAESPIRKFCEAYDMPRPQANPELKQIFSDPIFCCKYDPFAIWFLNQSEEILNLFREYLGVWVLNPEILTDQFFALELPKDYDRDEEIEGSKKNGWGNYLAQIPKPLPPINSIVLNDRHLLLNTNERSAMKYGFWGLNNLVDLLNEVMPKNLKVPFHLLIFCQHPNLGIDDTNTVVDQFKKTVQGLRDYEIIIEIVYAVSRHKRVFYSNYFNFYADRGFNAFNNTKKTVLCGENDFNVVSHLNNPYTSGDVEYEVTRKKIDKIKTQCQDVYLRPNKDAEKFEDISFALTDSDDFFFNRLFS